MYYSLQYDLITTTNTMGDHSDDEDIDLTDADEVAAETDRLLRSRRGFRRWFTTALTTANNVVNTAIGPPVNRTQAMADRLDGANQDLKKRYERLNHINQRLYLVDQPNQADHEAAINNTDERYQEMTTTVFNAIAQVVPAQAAAAAPAAGVNPANGPLLKPIQDLKPYTLGLEHSPTELADWIQRFQSYYTASRLDRLPVPEQQAFLRQSLAPGLWIMVKQKINNQTQIFVDDDNEESCIQVLQEEFTLRYPLIMRRFEFFRYCQARNQNYTDFFAKLKDLGAAANLETMRENDYFIFRIVTGITDKDLRDKILEISADNFDIEEVDKVARSYEAAKACTTALQGRSNQASKATHNKSNKGNKSKANKSSNTGHNNYNGKQKLDEMKRLGKCLKCARTRHPDGQSCPHASSSCHTCGKQGHISPACSQKPTSSGGQSRSNSRASSPQRNNAAQASTDSHTSLVRAIFQGSRPTPKLEMAFSPADGRPFKMSITPDTGATRTIIALDVMNQHGIAFDQNIRNERLFNASNDQMCVNGTVMMPTQFGDTSKIIDALVSKDIQNEILVSWHDLEDLKAISIARTMSHGYPEEKLTALKKKYSSILSDKLSEKPMSGTPMKIHLKKNAVIIPKKIYTATQIPLHYNEEAAATIRQALEDKVIEEVPVNEPSDWCSRGFFVPKPDGKRLRMVVDLSPVNEFIERPIHPFVAGTDLIKNIKHESKVFAKLDAVMGYFQIPLDQDSKKLTTFLLPSGRYRYCRAPMGLSASSDEWCKRSDLALQDLPGTLKLVDDILIEATDYEQLFARIEAVLQRCKLHNITISLRKLEVGAKVTFAGFHISADGVTPLPERTKSIKDFPTPHNVTELKSFLGLAQQLGHFLPDMALVTSPLRELLKKNKAWLWLPDQEAAFIKMKSMLTGDLMLRHFNPLWPTEVVTDASRKGLGFALMQTDPATGYSHLIQCGSRCLTDAETRYAVCELEGLAILYAIKKCRHYLLGQEHFVVVTDHKPLKGIFTKDMSTIENVRLRNYREKLTEFTFQLQWREGKTHFIADALSRAPVFPANEPQGSTDTEEEVCKATSQYKVDPKLAPLVEAAAADDNYKLLIQGLLSEKSANSLPASHPGRSFSNVWQQLSVDDNLGLVILDGRRIVVPGTQRKNILDALHIAHCGIFKSRQHAKALYYWPGLNMDIKNIVDACDACKHYLPSQPREPLIPTLSATSPMSDVGVDLFQIGHNHYLTMVDRYSGFPWCAKLHSLTSTAIIKILTSWFQDFGWPERIRSDGGPQFRREFELFCEDKHILHEKSSPYNPASNGLAEAAVKQVKHLLAKCDEHWHNFKPSLLEFRNCPTSIGYSPAQLFYGRRLRGCLPTMPGSTDLDINNAINGGKARKEAQSTIVDKFPSNELAVLSIGQHVLIQNPITLRWDDRGVIKDIRSDKRSYEIILSNGKPFIRNRKFLRPMENSPDLATPANSIPVTDDKAHPRRSPRLLEQAKLKKAVRFGDTNVKLYLKRPSEWTAVYK